ncbi:MAG: hypothetical protein EZS28_011175 [Streblomastix strix]|uniref:Dynein heavy chain tail domain-containing protein n=1 Tax=Streblomastix strix TaxID=222440 RepID=A0A5J4WEB7_9EUKA|nr:MAG: hypothetical protein EZS28_011175 [Streblomastix strix]
MVSSTQTLRTTKASQRENSKKLKMCQSLWLISESFSSVESMGALFMKITNRLCERAKERIPVENVLQLPHKEAEKIIDESLRLLKRFKDAYYKERRKIEDAGEIRWEFHHRFNFLEQIDNIIGVCKGLNAMQNDQWGNIIYTFEEEDDEETEGKTPTLFQILINTVYNIQQTRIDICFWKMQS